MEDLYALTESASRYLRDDALGDLLRTVPEFLKFAGSTFAGAYLAFWFDRRKDAEARTRQEIEAGYAALLTLSEMLANVAGIQKSLVEGYRDQNHGWWGMPQLGSLPRSDYRIEPASLSFLMTTGDVRDPRAVEAATHSTREYGALIQLLELRNTVKREAQERLTAVHKPDRDYSRRELQELFGPRLYNALVETARGIVTTTDAAVPRFHAAIEELRSALSRRHPQHRYWDFLGVSPVQDGGTNPGPQSPSQPP